MSELNESTLAAPVATPATPAAPARGESLWGAVREALRGSHRDYTEGPVGRAVMLLAIPMVLEMVMESVFAVTDVFFVGRLGPDAVATVGLTESLLTIVYTLAMGLSIAVTATVARRTGEHDAEGAAHAAAQGIVLGLVVALLLGAAGVLLAPTLLGVMGASPEVVASGSNFTRVMLGGNASILLLFLVNAIFRGAGDAALAMRTLWLANAINIVLGPCLIFGVGPLPELGVTGAAVATTIGRGAGVLYGLSHFWRHDSRVDVRPHHFRLDPALMLRLVRLSGSGTLQVLIGAASWIGLVRIVATFGSEALAGYTIAIRVILFALFPAFGLGNAAATMVGQALGARKPERAEQAVRLAGTYNTVFLGLVSLVFVLGAPTIAGFFTDDPTVLRYATDGLRVMAATFVLYAFGMVYSQAFNGAGDTWTPTLLNLVTFWLLQIPLAAWLSLGVGMGVHGAYLAVAIAFSLFTVLAAVMFRRGRWKARVV